GRGAVLSTGFAPAEPAHGGEAGAGSGLVLHGGEVGGPVVLGLDGERPGGLGAHLLGDFFGLAAYSSTLVVLGAVGGALGVEPGGDLLPSCRRPLCAFGFVVEAGDFFGDEPHGAVVDEAAHGFFCGVG